MKEKTFGVRIINTVQWLWDEDEYSFLKDPRPSHGLLTVEKGKVDYIIGEKTITLKKGDFIYLPKNSMYKARFHINEGEVKTLLVNFDLDEGANISRIALRKIITDPTQPNPTPTKQLPQVMQILNIPNPMFHQQSYKEIRHTI